MRFGKRGKLSPRYIGPFEILEKVGARAYRVALPPNLEGVHNVFHISMLRKYLANPSHVIRHEPVEWTSDLSYEEMPVQILDRQVRRLRNRDILMVKVLWLNQLFEEATWETERDIRVKSKQSYKQVFTVLKLIQEYMYFQGNEDIDDFVGGHEEEPGVGLADDT
ncbi:uncharacterized protein [Henckelia pumila]|uniref:uncharacterized protein n=1 Tax=Henckelia pumila TaxID=405737 RepID=UPI003C6E1729